MTFCLILPRKMRKICVRAYLKSTILKKKVFLKTMTLNEKVFVKSVILIEFLSSSQISYQLFHNASDLELKILQRVRF